MKKLAFISLMVVFFAWAGKAVAFEGEFSLQGDNVACQAVSVWEEESYRVIGRCEGLVYPYQTQYEHYAIWADVVDRDALVRIDGVERGFFQGRVSDPFERLVITAETDDSPRRPSQYIVAEGTVTKFDFDRSAAPTPTPGATPAPNGQTVPQTDTGSTVGRIIGRIFTALLVIFLVLVGVVIVGSLIFRRRGSVSA